MDSTTAGQRPMGVTVIAILAIIVGALGICGSLALLGLGGAVLGGAAGTGTDVAAAGGLTMGLGAVTLIISILQVVFGIGAWMLKPWAWTLGLGLMGVSILLNIVSIINNSNALISSLIGIVIAGVIIYYLMTPGVKAAFGRT